MLSTTVVVLLVLSVAAASLEDKSLDEGRLSKKDIECLINDNKCTKWMARVKETLLMAFKDDCVECSDDDKTTAGRAMATMMMTQPKLWSQFVSKHDTDNRFKKLHAAA